jgi:hypothetical protein
MRCGTVEVERVGVIDILNNERKGMPMERHPGELIAVISLSHLKLLGKMR